MREIRTQLVNRLIYRRVTLKFVGKSECCRNAVRFVAFTFYGAKKWPAFQFGFWRGIYQPRSWREVACLEAPTTGRHTFRARLNDRLWLLTRLIQAKRAELNSI